MISLFYCSLLRSAPPLLASTVLIALLLDVDLEEPHRVSLHPFSFCLRVELQ